MNNPREGKLIATFFVSFLLITLAIRIGQLVLSSFPQYYQSSTHHFRISHPPFISIHLPICEEPPDIVIQTIKSLEDVNYDNYEIIVLDNNTKDKNKWQPVQQYCGDKPNIKFIHIPQLDGHKAGALNKCLHYSQPDSEYILVVDADYKVNPNILRTCIGISENAGNDLLQFPQSYRNNHQNSELNLEYYFYFKIFMNMANWFNCVLSTGTLSFIRRSALEDIGGWHGDTITEDAELGVRLLLSGYKTLYLDQEMGHGLVPFEHKSYTKQRDRWVTGNIQVLKKHVWSLFRSGRLSIRQKTGILFQLTAWVDFKILALCLFGIVHAFLVSPFLILIFWVYFFLMIFLKILMYQQAFDRLGMKKILGIYFINQSIVLTTGLYWLRAFTNTTLNFEVTNKQQIK